MQKSRGSGSRIIFSDTRDEANRQLLLIYKLLLASRGFRNWWPAKTEFEVVVGAVLAQFVAWSNVQTAIARLEAEGLMSVGGICGADEERLGELIISTRFYKQKARKLKAFFEHINNKYEGSLEAFLENPVQLLREELLSLYGIGRETADSIILYAAHKPVFVVDAYTRRVFSRLGYFEEDITYGEMQSFFMDSLERDTALYNDFHAQIVALGASCCKSSRPSCLTCPLNAICRKISI